MPTPTTDISTAYLTEAGNSLSASLEKILHCLSQLSDADLHWRPHASGNSISNILLHLCGNVRQWIICPITSQPDERDRPAEFSDRQPYSRQELIARLSSTVTEARQAIASLSAAPERLVQVRHIQEWDVTLLAAIFSSVSHFVGHAHQIAYITRLRLGDAYRFHWTPRAAGQATVPV